MDGQSFDDLARQVFRITRSRRTALRLLTGFVASAAGGGRLGPPPRLAAAAPGQALEYFALGDSLAAGHGLMPTLNERDFDGTERPGTACLSRDVDGNGDQCCAPAPGDGSCCRRSSKAYPHKVAADLRRRYQLQLVPLTHHLACTGATSEHLDSQVAVVLGRLRETVPVDRPVLVSITVGPNDFPWGDPDFGFSFLFWKSDQEFQAELEGRIAGIKQRLKTEVLRLLDNHDADKHNPNVRVVLTEIHNPFHRKSVFFGAATLIRPYRLFVRTERTVDALVRIYREIAYEIYAELGEPKRVAVAKGIRKDFKDHQHESPRWEPGAQNYWNMGGGCGYDLPPGRSDTWVQYRDDPDSNSFPSGATNALKNIDYPPPNVVSSGDPSDPIGNLRLWNEQGGMVWRGDCFHPNDKGQQAFAHRVLLAANALGFGDCAAGWLPCDGICRNAQTDPHHCGTCGNDCHGKLCRDGVCVCKNAPAVCSSDEECCSGVCFQLEGPPFQRARCEPVQECAPGETKCGEACVTLGTDVHCAACGDACAAGRTCCGSTCVDRQTDTFNCGACGNDCQGKNCREGACVCKEVGLCGSDEECCSGVCFQPEGPPFQRARCEPVEASAKSNETTAGERDGSGSGDGPAQIAGQGFGCSDLCGAIRARRPSGEQSKGGACAEACESARRKRADLAGVLAVLVRRQVLTVKDMHTVVSALVKRGLVEPRQLGGLLRKLTANTLLAKDDVLPILQTLAQGEGLSLAQFKELVETLVGDGVVPLCGGDADRLCIASARAVTCCGAGQTCRDGTCGRGHAEAPPADGKGRSRRTTEQKDAPRVAREARARPGSRQEGA